MGLLKTGEMFRQVLRKVWTPWRRGVAVLALVVPATFVLGPACQIVGGYRSFEGAEAAAPHPCSALGKTSKVDDKQLGTLVLSNVPGDRCYWIDALEVTVQQYATFIRETNSPNPPINWDALGCGWKTAPSDPAAEQPSDSCAAMAMSSEQDPFNTMKPIRCIDWCDAMAFCKWANKDLCGGNPNAAGGTVVPHDVPDQWGYACSPTGQWPYGSGLSPVSGACNIGLSQAQCQVQDMQQGVCAPTIPASFSQCVSPSGAWDMIGNVAEWTLSCGSSDGGPDTPCQVRGGSFDDNLDSVTCYSIAPYARQMRDRHIGLRCCEGLNATEMNTVGMK